MQFDIRSLGLIGSDHVRPLQAGMKLLPLSKSATVDVAAIYDLWATHAASGAVDVDNVRPFLLPLKFAHQTPFMMTHQPRMLSWSIATPLR